MHCAPPFPCPKTKQKGTESSLLSFEILLQHYKTAFSFVKIQIYVHLPTSLQDFQPQDHLLCTYARLALSRYHVLLLMLHLKSCLEEQSMLPMNQMHSIRPDTCKSQPSPCSWVGFKEKWLHPGKPPCKRSPRGWHDVQPSPQLQKAFPKVASRAAQSLARSCSRSRSMLGGVWLTFSCISAQATSSGSSTLDCIDRSNVMGSKSQSGP